jgi:ferredoxin
MRIALDTQACVGHGRCYALAPEVYDADDEGHCVLVFGEDQDIPADLEAKARLGAANCPEQALTVADED